MNDFKRLMASRTGFLPRTQTQALVAMSQGIVREEFFVNKAVNIHPVFEEPWDFGEIERLLAKDDLGMDTVLVLMSIFERLIQGGDKESALFAAESINALEVRYRNRIQALKKKIVTSLSVESARTLVAACRDLSRLYFARPMLRNFYLAEARQCFERYRETLGDDDQAVAEYAGILLELGLQDEADRVIVGPLRKDPESPEFRALAAKSAFARRDYLGVVKQMEKSCVRGENQAFSELQQFWTKSTCHD